MVMVVVCPGFPRTRRGVGVDLGLTVEVAMASHRHSHPGCKQTSMGMCQGGSGALAVVEEVEH